MPFWFALNTIIIELKSISVWHSDWLVQGACPAPEGEGKQ